MPSPYKEIPITFEKGLVNEIEESLLDVGQASALENWEPSANGALRARNRYSSITTDGLTAPYNVRGFGAIATGTAVAGAVAGPVVVQSSNWPNNIDADPLATKTITLNGVNIGNVLIAFVSDDSALSPTVSGGWTERAVSTGDKEYTKFYTKTAASSTEAFTYTIATARIRAVSVFEVKYLTGEDPSSVWAAASQNAGGSGTDSVTVTNADTDGAFTLVGYTYDGGTPNTANSGTSGWTTPTLVNGNPRTGVSFEDIDSLDGIKEQSPATSISYVSPSWTPPASGVIIVLIAAGFNSSTANIPNSCSVSGNGLTWHDAYDAGELGEFGSSTSYHNFLYAWADCSLVSPTPGAITVTVGDAGGGNMASLACSFVKAIGADTTDPFVQADLDNTSFNATITPNLSLALLDGSGVLGIGAANGDPPTDSDLVTPTLGASDFEANLDSLNAVNSGGPAADAIMHVRTAYASSSWSPNSSFTMDVTNSGAVNNDGVIYEIKGQGNAAKLYKGTVTSTGTMIENFGYVANKRIVAKMVSWGYEPPTVQADVVDFYIVMAVAVDATTYKIYRIPRDEITTGTWEQIDTVTDASATSALVSFAQGAGHLVWTASTMGYPRAIELATLSNFNITDLIGLAGRTAAYHKDRMFIAGSTQNPSRVYFSDIGLPTDFTTVTDYLDIGGDDGEAIQDLSSVEGLLLIPKTNRAYLVSGSGIESFFVNELAGGTAATGRSAIRTPYGTILSGEDDIWVVQGGGVDPMSRPLGAGYVITGSVSSAYAQDSVLVCDSATEKVWRVNLVTGAWSTETVTGDDAGVYIIFSLNGRIYYGVDGSSVTVGGTRKLSDARTYDENTGGTNFLGATGRVALLGPSVKYTPRWLFLQTRNHDIAHPNTLFVDIESDHGTTRKAITVASSTQRDRIDIPKEHTGSEWIKLTLSSDSSAIAGSIDPERLVLGVDVEAPR